MHMSKVDVVRKYFGPTLRMTENGRSIKLAKHERDKESTRSSIYAFASHYNNAHDVSHLKNISERKEPSTVRNFKRVSWAYWYIVLHTKTSTYRHEYMHTLTDSWQDENMFTFIILHSCMKSLRSRIQMGSYIKKRLPINGAVNDVTDLHDHGRLTVLYCCILWPMYKTQALNWMPISSQCHFIHQIHLWGSNLKFLSVL